MRRLVLIVVILLSLNSIFCQTVQFYPTCEEAAEHPLVTKDQWENTTFALLDSMNLAGPYPLCSSNGDGVPSNIAWISFITGLGSENFDIEIHISNCIGVGGIQWGIVENCDYDVVICDGACTNNLIYNIVTSDLIPCNQYWLWVDGCNTEVCDFEFIVNDGIPDTNFNFNDTCEQVCTQGLFPDTDLDGDFNFICLEESMANATPEILFSECGFDTIPTVWFKVFSDLDAAHLFANVSVQGNGMWDPVFAVYQGDCPDLEPLSSINNPHCNYSFQVDHPAESLSTYWIAVGAQGDASEINANPFFEICVATTIEFISCLGNASCNPVADWELINSDVDTTKVGPIDLTDTPELCPGETIEICIEFLYNAAATGVDGLGGVVPFFGEGWDQSQFDPANSTAIGAEQFADWYEESVPVLQEDLWHLCTYTDGFGNLQICNTICRTCPCTPGLVEGTPLPAGWWWVSEGSLPGCDNDGTPGEGYGLGYSTAEIDICLSLTVRDDFNDQMACEQADLTFGIQTFSDGVAGCWEDPYGECVFDMDQFVKFNINCDEDVFYEDQDGDGFGNNLVSITACAIPVGYVSNNEDCDDSNAAINPDALEVCDLLDNDCNGLTDDNLEFQNYFEDQDGDSFGNPNEFINACMQPSGYVSDNTDCDDTSADINPDGEEVCDSIDNNCNNQIDENILTDDYYADNDMDGFGDINNVINSCAQPQGYVLNNSDCDDTNAEINPDAEDFPNNGIDEDCDGMDAISDTYEVNRITFKIFPNPTSGMLFIEMERPIDLSINLYTIYGEKILHQTTTQLDLSNFPNGVYLMSISSSILNEQIIERIVLNH